MESGRTEEIELMAAIRAGAVPFALRRKATRGEPVHAAGIGLRAAENVLDHSCYSGRKVAAEVHFERVTPHAAGGFDFAQHIDGGVGP